MKFHPEFSMEYRYKRCGICAYTKELEPKFMISLKELNPNDFPTTPEINKNLTELLIKINKVRTAWSLPMTVTSGLRDMNDHLRIYKEKNDKLKEQGLPPVAVPMASKHLHGQAVDIADRDGHLMNWTKSNIKLMEEIGLWMEDGTSGWVHFQSVPSKSGNRFFLP